MWRSALVLGPLAGCAIENSFVPGKGSDTFYQEVVDEVDILFVVDDSNSMQEEQEALAAGFTSFVEELETANSNFHIGVISTSQDTEDPNRGILIGDPPFLTAEDDYVAAFAERVQIGVGGSDKEKGLDAAWYALSPEMLVLHNVGFLRPAANLLVIVVSDEDDCSDDGFLDGRDSTSCYQLRDLLTPVRELVTRVYDSKNNGELVQISAIIGPFDGSCGRDAYSGKRYAQAALMTGGIIGRICDPDWSNVLYEVGLNATGILDTFVLSEPADADSIVVTVNGLDVKADPANGWTYDPQYTTLHFNGTSVPPRGAEIHVEYDLAPVSGASP